MALEQIINCKCVDNTNFDLLDKVEATYNSSFPEEERREFCLVRKLCNEEVRFKIYILECGDKYVGFISTWSFEDFIYIEHFAIDESARNGGIGGKAIRQFLELSNKPVVLEVELPNDEISKRRIGFYERLGFVLDNHVYFQPPYRKDSSSIEMRLMSYGDIDLSRWFSSVVQQIHSHVYGVK